ncbi:MAG: universal stress protein [Thermoleophilia bacterium]
MDREQTPSGPAPSVFRHIGCCFDGAPADDIAVRYAVGVARDGSRLSLVHSTTTPIGDPLGGRPDDDRESAAAAWDSTLGKLAARIPGAAAVTLRGEPGPAICRWAQEQGCDLIVVSARHPGPWGMSVLGGVTRHVLDNAPCPVLVVRASGTPDPAGRG